MAYTTIATPRPAIPPPDSALPGLPALKTRNGSNATAPSRLPSATHTSSRLAIRTPSKPTVSPSSAHAKSTPAIPTLRSMSKVSSAQEKSADTEIRRSVSIASFPEPPGVHKRVATASRTSPPSPSFPAENGSSKLDSSSGPVFPGGRSRLKRLRIAEDPPGAEEAVPTLSVQSAPNEGGAASKVDTSNDINNPDIAGSPAASRSSSQQDSCSTSATTFEDVEDARRGRGEGKQDSSSGVNTANTKETKGNVIVSVRVRPDASGNGDKGSEGEWMVDGRRSLVAYRGREGGDYYYGELAPSVVSYVTHPSVQTMFLQLMTRTTRSTTLLRKGWSAESWRATMARCLHMV